MDGDWDPFDQLEQDADALATAGYDGDPEPDTPHNDTDEAVCQAEALEVKPYAQAPQEQAKASQNKMKRYHKHDLQGVRALLFRQLHQVEPGWPPVCE
eukprot:3784869-Pyramimonas_sp.AAC.1